MDLEQKAIERIKLASEMSLRYYKQPLVCTYSGGKDSDVMLELFKRSGIKFEVQNSHTTVDAPQTVYHIRKKFRELELQGIKCTIQKPVYKKKPITMWTLIPIKVMPPTRGSRYCCSILKESNCPNRMIATGIRWDESRQRQDRTSFEVLAPKKENKILASDEVMLLTDNSTKRKMIEKCELKAKSVCNPIIDWLNRDIWEYMRSENIEYNILYEMGYTRVGCIGCPLGGRKGRYKAFADFPTYERAYKKAFERMLQQRKIEEKMTTWKNADEVFDWWMNDTNVEGQFNLLDLYPEVI